MLQVQINRPGLYSASSLRAGLVGKLLSWITTRSQRAPAVPPALRLIERISIAPRQALALIEADGQRLLVATSADGAPTFYALSGGVRRSTPGRPAPARAGRCSW